MIPSTKYGIRSLPHEPDPLQPNPRKRRRDWRGQGKSTSIVVTHTASAPWQIHFLSLCKKTISTWPVRFPRFERPIPALEGDTRKVRREARYLPHVCSNHRQTRLRCPKTLNPTLFLSLPDKPVKHLCAHELPCRPSLPGGRVHRCSQTSRDTWIGLLRRR
jgi:hypothetical protein